MRILLFPQYGYPCDHAMLESVYAKILPCRGHNVSWVMTSSQCHAHYQRADWLGTPVTLIPWRGGSLPRNIIGSIPKMRDMLRATRDFRRGQLDVIQVRNEISASLVAMWLRRRTGAKFIYQVSSPDAEFRMRLAQEGRVRPYYYHYLRGWFELTIRRWICRQANFVLTISDAMRNYMIERERLRPEQVVSFPLGYDAALQPASTDVNNLREQMGLGDDPVLIYAGTMAKIRRLTLLVDMLQEVIRSFPRTRLLMVGEGEFHQDVADLKHAFKQDGLGEHVIFTGRVSRERVAAYTKIAHISLAPIPPIFEYVVSSPTKVVESLGLEVPVVANEGIPDQENVVRSSQGGLIVPYTSTGFAQGVIQLLSSPQTMREMGRRGACWVKDNRSYEIMADLIEDVYLGMN